MIRLTPAAIARLRRHYERLREFGPLQASTVRALLHACEDEAVNRLASAGIRHVSRMAEQEARKRAGAAQGSGSNCAEDVPISTPPSLA